MKIRCFIISLLACLTAHPAFGQADNDSLTAVASGVFNQLDADQRYVEDLKTSDLYVLPFGMRKTISNNEFAIAVSSVTSDGNYVEMTAFARMKIGQSKKPIYFAATGLKFSAEAGFIGDASLVLIGDIDIPVNENMKITLKGGTFNKNGTVDKTGGTSMSIDCSGFKELVISAGLVLSQSLVTRVSDSGQSTGEAVSADFALTVNDWNNMIVELSLPNFQIKGLDGFIFSISNVVFDFSDFANSTQIPESYMSGYLGKHYPGVPAELWRGVYAGRVSMTLPKDFSNGGTQASISADNFLIDENGITGTIMGKDILPIANGNASGWAFSIDEFRIALETNKVTSGGFAGLIGLPVSENGVLLGYNAQIMGNNKYELTVAVKDSIEFDMLMAHAKLNKNSWVSLQMNNGKFLPEANLSGEMSINTSLGDSGSEKTALNGIKFTNLHLMTASPYISVDYMGYEGEIKLLGLPVSISNIAVSANNGLLSVGFGIGLNLDDKYLSAQTHLNISSEYGVNNNRGRWKYKGTTLDAIGINSEIANVLTLTGHLKLMNNDPSFGSGFYGDISLSFKDMLSNMNLTAAAAFGNKNGQRYWFVDGSVGFPTPIPVVGALGINGFGGGLSMGMTRVSSGGLGSDMTKTGCGFLPDPNAGLGLKAAVMFKTTSGNLVSGDASFEMIFNKSGGINTIGFYGYIAFTASIPGLDNIPGGVSSLLKKYVDKENTLVQGSLSKIADLEKKKNDNPSEAAKETTDAESQAQNANIAAAIGILYTQPTKTLHATFDFYVNAADGFLRGIGANNKAGSGELHISPSNWHIYMGTPDNPCGLQVGVPGIATLKATSYFMLGDNIPGSPPPPQEVTKYLSSEGEHYDYMRDLNGLKSGTGIAFGSSLKFDTGDLTFLILYARFSATVGFDLMIKDYKNAECVGRSGPIGMNGWYANGQVYAGFSGELGVKVNLWFIKGKFPIISTGCAALLQAKLPNPTWFGGSMGAHFNILGGLVKGNMRFKFNFGDECEIKFPGTSPLEVSMINDLSPAPNATGVDVFTAPQVALSNPAQTSFKVNDGNGEKTYRINLDRFIVKDGNNVIPGEIRWNSTNTVATFYSDEVLPPQKRLDLEVGVGFEEQVNGRWQTVINSGQKAVETRNISFTTGEAPDYIPLNNIVYTYPIIDQQYYYVKESTSGYVQLDRGQAYLFPSIGWTYNVRFDRPGKSETTAFSYDAANKRVHYTLPALARGQGYSVTFQSISSAKTNTTVPSEKENVLLEDGENKVVQAGAAAGQVIQEDTGKKILDYHFSASAYETFADKISKIKKVQTTVELEGLYIIGLGCVYSGISEGFGEEEIFGSERTLNKPMIQAKVEFTDSYYTNHIYPLIYSGYPPSGLQLTRQNDAVGIPPLYAFGKWMETGSNRFPVRYEASKYYYHDYLELQFKVVNANLRAHPLYNSAFFPDILSGKYPARLQYVLPGGETGTNAVFEYEINKK